VVSFGYPTGVLGEGSSGGEGGEDLRIFEIRLSRGVCLCGEGLQKAIQSVNHFQTSSSFW
jgi:hypothetical protein